jgi:hypothetical protein
MGLLGIAAAEEDRTPRTSPCEGEGSGARQHRNHGVASMRRRIFGHTQRNHPFGNGDLKYLEQTTRQSAL